MAVAALRAGEHGGRVRRGIFGVVVTGFALGDGAAAQVSLPADVQVIRPAPGVAAEIAQFSGVDGLAGQTVR